MILKLKNRSAFTLIEILLAASIFAIGFAGILLMNTKAKHVSENAMVNFCVIHYAQSLLELIQSYPYNEPNYIGNLDPNTPSSCDKIFEQHDEPFSVAFNDNHSNGSGIYDSAGNLVTPLTEAQIGLKYYRTSLGTSPTPDNPYERATSLCINERVIGPDDNDLSGSSDPSTGFYRIDLDKFENNIFGLITDNHNGKYDLAKYYYADDVDDFDGYKETREILPGVIATIEVSVQGVYTNRDDLAVTYQNGGATLNKTISQHRYDITKPIVVSDTSNVLGIDFNDASFPSIEAKKYAVAYYNQILFKKVTVKISWEYPVDSGIIRTQIINGGKPNPEGKA